MGKALDLVGKRFGRLVVVERTKDKNNKVSWHCMCDCGNDSYVGTYRLVHNVTTSCGCLREEKWRESQDKISAKAKDKITYDIIGKQFDKLTVLSHIGGTTNYVCRCECGNEVTRSRHTLLYQSSAEYPHF